jgi:hypothetical protein
MNKKVMFYRYMLERVLPLSEPLTSACVAPAFHQVK